MAHEAYKNVISHKRTFLHLCMGQGEKKELPSPNFQKGTMDQNDGYLNIDDSTDPDMQHVLNTAAYFAPSL